MSVMFGSQLTRSFERREGRRLRRFRILKCVRIFVHSYDYFLAGRRGMIGHARRCIHVFLRVFSSDGK